MYTPIDLFAYQDLTERLGVYADDGTHLAGNVSDLPLDDEGEPAYAPGESEVARFAGALKIVGPRSTETSDGATLGLVLDGGGVLVLSTHRLILMALTGRDQLGTITQQAVHSFVLHWDLVDIVAMPEKKSLTDRIAGERTIEISCPGMAFAVHFTPFTRQLEDGATGKLRGEEAMRTLVDTIARHRWDISPPEHHAHLQRLIDGQFDRDDGELVAQITPDHPGAELPAHLEGRIVLHGDDPAPEADSPPTPAAAVGGFCGQCGSPAEPDDRYCGQCGAPQHA